MPTGAYLPKSSWRRCDRGRRGSLPSTRLKRNGPNALEAKKKATALGLFANQFKNPLVLILIFASIISLVAAEWIDATVVLSIVLGSTILGFAQEYIAGNAIEKLRSQVTINQRQVRQHVQQGRQREQIAVSVGRISGPG